MSAEALKLIGDIETVIHQGYRGDALRHTMLKKLNYARTIYAQRITDEFLKHDAVRELPSDVAYAICFPAVLTPEQIGEIIILFGNHFKWETGNRLNLLLDKLPGKHVFKPCESLNWTENVRLRMEKVPHASVVAFDLAQINRMITTLILPENATRDELRIAVSNSHRVNSEMGKIIGAIGHVTTGIGAGTQTSFYFEDRDTAVLAKLTYS